MDDFGNYLRTTREQKGIRLEEIASITKVNLHILSLLENNRFSELPPDPFIRGFITAYAKYVGLDPRTALAKYTEQLVKNQNLESPVAPATPKRPPSESVQANQIIQKPSHLSFLKVGVSVSVLLIAVVGLSLLVLGRRTAKPVVAVRTAQVQPTNTAAEPVSQSTTSPFSTPPENSAGQKGPTDPTPDPRLPASPQEASVAQQSSTSPIPAPEYKHHLTVEGKARVWMKIVFDDLPPKESFLQPGQTVSFSATQKIKLVLGDRTAARVLYNGTEDPGVKFQGTIYSYIFPANSRFPQDIPKKRETAEELDSDPPRATATDGRM